MFASSTEIPWAIWNEIACAQNSYPIHFLINCSENMDLSQDFFCISEIFSTIFQFGVDSHLQFNIKFTDSPTLRHTYLIDVDHHWWHSIGFYCHWKRIEIAFRNWLIHMWHVINFKWDSCCWHCTALRFICSLINIAFPDEHATRYIFFHFILLSNIIVCRALHPAPTNTMIFQLWCCLSVETRWDFDSALIHRSIIQLVSLYINR